MYHVLNLMGLQNLVLELKISLMLHSVYVARLSKSSQLLMSLFSNPSSFYCLPGTAFSLFYISFPPFFSVFFSDIALSCLLGL